MGRITSFVMGGLVGACAALALAPRTGAEARAAVAGKAAEVKDTVMGYAGQSPQTVYQDVTAGAASFVQEAAAKSQEAAAKVAGSVQETMGNGGSDELRQKIEAARARITEQMMANIDESREAVDAVEAEVEDVAAEAEQETAEAEVEAVEEATEE